VTPPPTAHPQFTPLCDPATHHLAAPQVILSPPLPDHSPVVPPPPPSPGRSPITYHLHQQDASSCTTTSFTRPLHNHLPPPQPGCSPVVPPPGCFPVIPLLSGCTPFFTSPGCSPNHLADEGCSPVIPKRHLPYYSLFFFPIDTILIHINLAPHIIMIHINLAFVKILVF